MAKISAKAAKQLAQTGNQTLNLYYQTAPITNSSSSSSSAIQFTYTNSLNSISNRIDTLEDFFCTDNKQRMSALLKEISFEEYQLRALLAAHQTAEIIDMDVLITSQKVSELFLEDFYNIINKEKMCASQKLSLTFINKHFDDLVNAGAISQLCLNQKLSIAFINKHKECLKWDSLARNSNIDFTYDFIFENLPLFERDNAIQYFSENIKIDNDMLNKLIETMDEDYIDKLNWQDISFRTILTEDNILRNLNRLTFESPLLKLRHYENVDIPVFMNLKYGTNIEEYFDEEK